MSRRLQDFPQEWMQLPASKRLFTALPEARFVGGCVRDGLLGYAIKDLDLAVPLLPEEVMARLQNAQIKVLPTGIDHGTVTAVVDHRPFEITSLRRDVEHDGRWAKVHFTKDWREDAMRRDLTINALYMSSSGEVFDYATGLEDLKQGKVRFMGQARERMVEDYLRILRFFRFHSRYALGPLDEEAALAAKELAANLTLLSAERIRAETLQLLLTPRLVETWEDMMDLDIVQHFLPQAIRINRLKALVVSEQGKNIAPDPIRRLAALLIEDTGEKVGEMLKLSNKDGLRLSSLVSSGKKVTAQETADIQKAIYHLGNDFVIDRALIDQPQGYDRMIQVARGWPRPDLPLSGKDLIKAGMKESPEIGVLLKQVEDWWIAEGFTPGKKQCLDYASRITRAIK